VKESNSSDNTVDWDVEYIDQPILRVGVLTDPSGLGTAYVQNALQLSKLNAFFADKKEQIEITTVPYQVFDNGDLSFEALGFDVVILYTNNFPPTNPLQSFQASLERFTSHGGVVLGLLCLGQSNNGVNLQSIQSFFGIDPEERFLLYRTSKPETEIRIQGEQDYFSSSYSIQNRYTVLPKGKNWHQIGWASSTELIGIDESGYAALLRNQNRWFYSGFLSDQDFKEKPASLEFFLDLLRTIRNPLPNIALERVSILPAVPTTEENMEIISTIVNTSMVTIDYGSIRVGEERVHFQNLLPKETRHISMILQNQEIGKHTEEIILDCPQDTDETDNTYTLLYQVKEKPIKAVKPSLFIQDMYEFYNSMETYGFVQPPYQYWNQVSYYPPRDVTKTLGGQILWDSSTQFTTIHPNNISSRSIRIPSEVQIHHENPSVEVLSLQTSDESLENVSYLGREKYPLYLPTCIDVYQDELYVSTPSGIYHVQDESTTCIFAYPDFLYRQYPSFIQSSHTTNHFFFRMHQDYIILSLNNHFLIFDRSTSQLSTIIQPSSSQRFLQPIEYYSTVTDMEVYRDTLYVLDVYNGFYIFNLRSGELMSSITIPNYLYNFEIIEDTIYACSYWGSLVMLQVDGSQMQEFEIPLSYCYRLFMLDPYTCLIGSLQNPTKLYSFDLKTEVCSQKKEIDLSLGLDMVEKVFMLKDRAIVLGYSYHGQSQIALKSGLFAYDQYLSSESKIQLFSNDVEEAQKDNSFLSHVKSLHRIPESPYLALEQGIPYTDQRIRLLDIQTGKLKSISTSTLHPGSDSIYATYWYKDTYSILFYHHETKEFWFRQFRISPKGSKKMVVSEKLQIQTSLFPDHLAVNDTGFCVLDQYQSSLHWFQWDGELTDTCKLLSGENPIQIPVSFDQMDLDAEDQVHIFDSSTKGIFHYDTAGFLSFTPIASLLLPMQSTNVQYSGQDYSLLDRHTSSIYSVKDQIVVDSFSSSQCPSIGYFTESEDQWYVYDEKSGYIRIYNKDGELMISP
jgi:hypothetical protein